MSTLTAQQQLILEEFILTFLPIRGNKRKSKRNEIRYLYETLKRVTARYFGFAISIDDMVQTFQQLHYSIYTKMGEWSYEKKDIVPSNTGDISGGLIFHGNQRNDIYNRMDAAFIYIDVDAYRVEGLYRTTLELIPGTNSEKLRERQELVEQIQALKAKYQV